MHPLPLLLAASVASASVSAEKAARAPENLLVGPARCVLRYLDAVRLAGPRPLVASARPPQARERDYVRANALVGGGGKRERGPLAPWRDAARARVLESFQLVAVRRAPRDAAVVTVKERFWRPGGALDRVMSEYLVARVDGEWKIVDRSPGAPFDDLAVEERYAGFFDDPPDSR
jgi:hypothetical protein